MKRFFCLMLLFFNSIILFSRKVDNHEDEILFEKALALQELVDEDLRVENDLKDTVYADYAKDINETILERALSYYKELIKEYPDSKVLYRALNNSAFLALKLDDKAEAIKLFQRILNSTADDSENGGVGSGIMGEPYANFKHRAAVQMAKLYMLDSNYSVALQYLELTNKYLYQHFCGNEIAADELYMAEQFGRCYVGLNNPDKAMEYLLPNILENGLASNTSLVDFTYQILLKRHSKEELKTKFENAFKNYQTDSFKIKKTVYRKFYITYLDKKLGISSWSFEGMNDIQKKEELEKEMKSSRFYSLLSN